MVESTAQQPLYAIPAPHRPPASHSPLAWLHSLLFFTTFNASILLISLLQLLSLPLLLFPFVPGSRRLYDGVMEWTKGNFGRATVWISQCFARTEFVISFAEPEERGYPKGFGVGEGGELRLPERAIWMSNHQTLADWLYLWALTYFANSHSAVIIILKSSLKWIPFVGWACQFFSFIFVSRSWLTDKAPFLAGLHKIVSATNTPTGTNRLALLIFPEGTLVTGNERPKSKKFADKLGVDDLKHTLLPRSTGLFFALRTLAREIPDLALIDVTLAYPAPTLPEYLPPHFYPEDFFSPLSIWSANIPPPQIHVHLRVYAARYLPLGSLEAGEGTIEEQEVFAKWLRARWGEKDDLMEKYLRTGSFVDDETKGQKVRGREVALPLKLKRWSEHIAVFSYFIPVFLLYFGLPVVMRLVGIVWSILASHSMVVGVGSGEL